MMIRSGFFNSVNGDRKYDARRFAEYFASFIGNGVFPNPSDNLQIIANNDMTVTVRPGKAWIKGYILINDDDYILEIEPADGVLSRIDRVVARYDTADREIRLEVKKGTFSSEPIAPELQRDADAYELGLADIYVSSGAISISQADITDLRLNSELCGIVHGTVEQVDTTTLFNQYTDWYTTTTGQAETDIEAIKQQFQADLAQFNQDWDNWFSQQQTEGFVLQTEKGQPNGLASLDENGKVPNSQLPTIEIPVTSVNNKTGDVNLTAEDIGAETPEGAQAKANTAEENAKTYADTTKASKSHTHTKSQITDFPTKLSNFQNDVGYITTQRQVSDSVSSTSSSIAASSKAVKTAYDKAVQALNTANTKLDAANYTASDVLTKLKTVDGSGSGIDADKLDGWHRDDIRNWSNILNKPSSFTPDETYKKQAYGLIDVTDFLCEPPNGTIYTLASIDVGFPIKRVKLISKGNSYEHASILTIDVDSGVGMRFLSTNNGSTIYYDKYIMVKAIYTNTNQSTATRVNVEVQGNYLKLTAKAAASPFVITDGKILWEVIG